MQFVRFRSPCPVCKSGYFYWNHENCGGDLYLNQNAKLFCISCFEADFVFRWKFNCNNHGFHSGGFKYGC